MSLFFHLLLPSCLVSSSFVLSCLLLFRLVLSSFDIFLSCLSSSAFSSPLSFSVFFLCLLSLSLSVSLCLSPSLSLSLSLCDVVCDVVLCCVCRCGHGRGCGRGVCFGVCVCLVCGVCFGTLQNVEKNRMKIPTRLRVYIQNVAVYASSTRTCTHGGVFESTHGGRREFSLPRKAHVEFSLGPREVHQRNPWILQIFKFEKRSRTTCPRFLQSFASPDKACSVWTILQPDGSISLFPSPPPLPPSPPPQPPPPQPHTTHTTHNTQRQRQTETETETET